MQHHTHTMGDLVLSSGWRMRQHVAVGCYGYAMLCSQQGWTGVHLAGHVRMIDLKPASCGHAHAHSERMYLDPQLPRIFGISTGCSLFWDFHRF